MKISWKKSEEVEDKKAQCGGINWQVLWQLSVSAPQSKGASALSGSVESLVERQATSQPNDVGPYEPLASHACPDKENF
jgi:hypothetical protein